MPTEFSETLEDIKGNEKNIYHGGSQLDEYSGLSVS